MTTLTARRLAVADNSIVDLLRAILDVQRQILAALKQQQRPSLSRADLAALSRLLPAIGGAFGSELFASAEVAEYESAALRLVCAGLTVRQLGRLLRRAVDVPVGGYMVQRQGAEAGAVLWRVVKVPEFPRNKNLSVPHA